MRPDHDSVANIIASFERDRARIAELAAELQDTGSRIADLLEECRQIEERPKMHRILREIRAELDEKQKHAAALETELTFARSQYRSQLKTALRPERAAALQGVDDALEAMLANWKLIDVMDAALNAAGDVVQPHVRAEQIALHLRAAAIYLHPMSTRNAA